MAVRRPAVARMLDDVHLVIRADFDYRDAVLRQFPGTFSVPARYIKHMMVVADLARGDAEKRHRGRRRSSVAASAERRLTLICFARGTTPACRHAGHLDIARELADGAAGE